MDLAGEIVGGWVDFFVDLFGGSSPEPARWQEPRAYRSYNSFASLAAQDVENFSESSADRVTFLSFARSGAEIRAGLLGVRDHGRDEWIGVGEIEEARRAVGNRQIDALIISIGGNDIGFAGSLTDLVIKDLLAWNPVGNDSKERAKTRKKVEQKLENELPQALDDLKRAIDKELAPRQVYILEYPTGLFEKTGPDGKVEDGGPCGIFASSLDMDLDVNDGQAIKALGKKLNALIRDKAQQFGWVFVSGIEAGFAGHGYCDDQTFFVGAEESCRNQGDFEGTMHPNQLGHQVYREQLVQALRLHLFQQAWLEPVLSTMLGTTPTGSWLEPVLNVTMR